MARTKTAPGKTRETAVRLRISIGAFRRRTQEALDEGELTESQLRVLSQLERHGSATTAELARRQQMSPQAMSATTGTLEDLGYLSRAADISDGRRIILDITKAGRQAILSGRGVIVDRMTAALSASFTPDEIATLDEAARLIERLSDLI